MAGCITLALTICQAAASSAAGQATTPQSNAFGRVIIVHDAEATEAYKPQPKRIVKMMEDGITKFSGEKDRSQAWRSLFTPKDIIGIKVFCAPGGDAGTRVSVVAAVIEGLIEAKIPAGNIIIWDRQRADLRRAGFMDLGARLGVRVDGSVNAGFDEAVSYTPEQPAPTQLVWGDLEFERKGEGVGRRSFVTRLLTRDITKIISIAPMLNHNTTGVSGHLYSLAQGGVDNFMRFENDLNRLATAVPEIYGLPALADKVVLNITDGLICQYQGEQQGLLHYSTMLNELRFSKDPVALDSLSLRELERTRQASSTVIQRETSLKNQMELLNNAALLELGLSDPASIRVERTQ